jgi:hypothetical protein
VTAPAPRNREQAEAEYREYFPPLVADALVKAPAAREELAAAELDFLAAAFALYEASQRLQKAGGSALRIASLTSTPALICTSTEAFRQAFEHDSLRGLHDNAKFHAIPAATQALTALNVVIPMIQPATPE